MIRTVYDYVTDILKEELKLNAGLKEKIEHELLCLTERERDIIKRRIGFAFAEDEVCTLEDVALKYGVGRERIRQIEAKAIRKLLHHRYRQKRLEEEMVRKHKVTFFDYNGDIVKEEMVEEGKDATPPRMTKTFILAFAEWNKSYKNIRGETHIGAIYGNIEEVGKQEDLIEEKDIEFLNLSVRAYRCLKRGNIHTVGELALKTEEELMRVRNLGRKSLREIKQKLEENGLVKTGKESE